MWFIRRLRRRFRSCSNSCAIAVKRTRAEFSRAR
jgi:hypothetical protein